MEMTARASNVARRTRKPNCSRIGMRILTMEVGGGSGAASGEDPGKKRREGHTPGGGRMSVAGGRR